MAEHTNKEVVIAMRDALKAGKNLPLKVYCDNVHIMIDESAEFMFTLWDDDNGVVYVFRLMDLQHTRIPNNKLEQSISVGAVKYEFIQAMEVAPMPLKFFDDICGTLRSSSTDMVFTDEFQEHIKKVFTRALDDSKSADLLNSTKNAVHGLRLTSQRDQWNTGRRAEPFKETHTTDLMYRAQRIQNEVSEPEP